MKAFVFRLEKGKLGFFQVRDGRVYFILKAGMGNFDADGMDLWDTWCQHKNMEQQATSVDVTSEVIEFFLRRKSITGDHVVELREVKHPGAYYPRMMRENLRFTHQGQSFLQDMRAYQNIQSSLDSLFNFIEPAEINLKTYGHKIRELLILACTEAEYLLLKTLTENGYTEKQRYNTTDYIKCRDILRLNQYEVGLTQYSNLGIFTPFKGWTESSPTTSIPWYDAHNQVKHNRSDNIPHANLKHLLDAVAAIHILLESQYGERIFQGLFGAPEYKSVFYTLTSPEWELDEITAPILKTEDKFYRVQAEWLNQRKYFEDHPY